MLNFLQKWSKRKYHQLVSNDKNGGLQIPLFVQRNSAEQNDNLKQALLGMQQLQRQTEIERDKARMERDAEAKKYNDLKASARKDRRKWADANRRTLFLVIVMAFLIVVFFSRCVKVNSLVGIDKQWAKALTAQSGEVKPNLVRNFRAYSTYETGDGTRDSSVIVMKPHTKYTVEWFVADYNTNAYQTDLKLYVSVALESGKAGYTKLKIDMGDGDTVILEGALVATSDLAIKNVTITKSYRTDGEDQIRQYLADHNIAEDQLQSQFAERLWHFVAVIETGSPEYTTTIDTKTMTLWESFVGALTLGILISLVTTIMLTLNWDTKYKYESWCDAKDSVYNDSMSQLEFVAKIEAYLENYYNSEEDGNKEEDNTENVLDAEYHAVEKKAKD